MVVNEECDGEDGFRVANKSTSTLEPEPNKEGEPTVNAPSKQPPNIVEVVVPTEHLLAAIRS